MSDILFPRKKPVPPLPLLAVAVPVAVLAAGLGLWLLSTPPHLPSRLKAIETQAASLKTAAGEAGDLKAFPAGSVCAGDFTDAARQKLMAALARSGLKVTTFDLTDIGAAGRTGLEAYRFTFKGEGAYAQAVAAMAAMDTAQPRLFVDALALRNHVDSVELEVEGRLFCR